MEAANSYSGVRTLWDARKFHCRWFTSYEE